MKSIKIPAKTSWNLSDKKFLKHHPDYRDKLREVENGLFNVAFDIRTQEKKTEKEKRETEKRYVPELR